ncbi:hypothetical protein DPSP01_009494 [Paraphaeosphaeria sporulosa]|uniref:G-patch domain-containing protein n=1 Tax=Paraphaeosphaeria sporulosa TaxID=1460663 RepID=A0A177C3F9_9PLEO|nr:uncharacterized protein CC84DRAFT_1168335 [Paraphaeosphaeria sporulosa]OAG01200.1 hypothetical protein CC84DRAFT_1168335 [Paraphaeosphaeria sporulosa]
MNAEGLLRRQGWRGAGFSLDTSDRGIKKPLLISHKQDQLGLGKKKASHTTDDQWWMRAFDESLQNLGSGKTSTLSQIQEKGINRGGLYGFFVKGEGLQGSIGEETSIPASGATTPPTSVDDSSTDESESDSDSMSSDDAASDSSKLTKAKKSQNKRKREAEEDVPATKKLKQETGGVKIGARAQASANGEVRTGMGPISADAWPQMCAVTSRIGKQVKASVKKNEKAGAYGDATNVDDPKVPGTKLGKKAVKQQQQKVIRAAKKQMAKELVVEAILNGDLPMLNPENLAKEDILQNYGKISKAIKAVENANKISNKTERQAKREQRKEAKGKVASGKARSKAAAQQQPTEQSLIEAHLSRLSPEKQVDYAARAAEKGQTLEEYTLRRIEKKEAKRIEKEPKTEDEKAVATEAKGESGKIAPWRAQKKVQSKLKKEQKTKSEKLASKVKNKYEVGEKAKARNTKIRGDDEGGVKDMAGDQSFMEKAARFGAIAKPIAAAA